MKGKLPFKIEEKTQPQMKEKLPFKIKGSLNPNLKNREKLQSNMKGKHQSNIEEKS